MQSELTRAPTKTCKRYSTKLILQKWIRLLGYDVHSLPHHPLTLRDLEVDLRYLVEGPNPVVLDIGANTGQSIEMFRRFLNKPRIFSFEPNPALAFELQTKYSGPDVLIESTAVGSTLGVSKFNILQKNDLSSILELDRTQENPFSDTGTHEVIEVDVTTVDDYARVKNIARIDLLKIDTQGFDLEVIRGSVEMLRRRAIRTLLIEVNFVSLYKKQSSFGDIERFLAANGYGLLTFYEIHRSHTCISWATACFRPLV